MQITSTKITLLLLLIISSLINNSNAQCFPPFSGRQPSKSGHSDLYSGQQEFSLALLNAINKMMPNENLFFSPYSTYHALLMAYFLAGKQTEMYLKKVLRLNPNQDKSDFYAAYKTDKFLTSLLARSAPYEFKNANKIYVEKQIPVRECVLNDFPDELEMKDFVTNPENARMEINKWVENITNNMIKDLLPAGTIDAETNLVLVNAAYFKGFWENKFPVEQTKKEVFFVNPGKQIFVDMMHVEGTFKHDVSETLGAHILEMPYQGGNVSLYVLLPPWSDTENALDSTLKKLTLENFRSVTDNDNLIPKTVQVAFPKFSLETTLEMTPILRYMQVGDLFDSTSDLSVLTDSTKVKLGAALHKAKIEINEEGTKAAAATSFFTFRSSRPAEPAQFICNHPFIYVLYEKSQKAVLFSGLFRRPT